MRLLISGFEPFGGSAVNPSHELVRALAARSSTLPRHVELHTITLAVDAARGPAQLLGAVDEFEPDAVLCLGESARAAAITIERVFVNLADYRIPDNAGVMLASQPIAPGGPAAYFATLPAVELCEAVRAAKVPAELSLSAGAFLCNHVAYALLHHLSMRGRSVPAGFVHLPRLPEQACDDPQRPCMPLERMIAAVDAMIEALARAHAASLDRARAAAAAARC